MIFFFNSAQYQSTLTVKRQDNSVQPKTENRSAYIPFPSPVTETLKLPNEKEIFGSTASQSSSLVVQPAQLVSSVSPIAVDLHVTNLDQSIGAKEMKALITSVFKQHVMVKSSWATFI